MKYIEAQSRRDDKDRFYGILLAISIGVVLAVVLVEWCLV